MSRPKPRPAAPVAGSALDRLMEELRPALVSLTAAGKTAAVADLFEANGARCAEAWRADWQAAAVVVGVVVESARKAVSR